MRRRGRPGVRVEEKRSSRNKGPIISVVVLTAVVVVVAAVMVVVMVMVMVVAFIFIVFHIQEKRMCVRENTI